MQQLIKDSVEASLMAVEQLSGKRGVAFIEGVSSLLADVFTSGGKVLIAGNGGSLCDATHFAEELTGYFREDRPALPALALADPGHITCVGNDAGFNEIFARGIEAYGKRGDLFFALTTSGNSPNIVRAVEQAKEQGLYTAALLGKGGGKLKGCCDHELIIEGIKTSDRIQEAHMTAIHIIIEMVEGLLGFTPNFVAEKAALL